MASGRLRIGHGSPSIRSLIAEYGQYNLIGRDSGLEYSGITANEFFISPTGSNSNSGTQQSPWALSALQTKPQIAGATVWVMDGTYVLTAEPSGFLECSINISYGGPSAAQPTVVRAVNPRQAIIYGQQSIGHTSGGGLFGTNQSNVHIVGLTVHGGCSKGIVCAGASESSHITGVQIRDCEVYDIDANRTDNYNGSDNTEGIRIEYTTGLIIRNNWVHDVTGGRSGTGSGQWGAVNTSGVKVYKSFDAVIEYNTFSECGTGMHSKEVASIDTIMRYNHVYNCGTMFKFTGGTYAPNGRLAEFHHNLGERIYNIYADSTVYTDINRVLDVYNNTFVPITGGWDTGGLLLSSAVAGRLSYYNNIIWRTGGSDGDYGDLGIRVGGVAAFNKLDYNVYGSAFSHAINDVVQTTGLSGFKTRTGKDVNSVDTNPNFVGGAGDSPERFKYLAGSAINLGRVGGTSGGATCNAGVYESAAQTEQIGKDW